jgi:hypothetical protein
MPLATCWTSAPGQLADARHGVDVGDLHRQERVRGVLGQLRARHAHAQEFAAALLQDRLVDFLEQVARALAFHAHHDAVGMRRVLDRRAFAQEFGIRGHVEIGVFAQVFQHGALEVLARLGRHGALLDQQAVARHVLRHLAADLLDVGHVGLAPHARRRARRR